MCGELSCGGSLHVEGGGGGVVLRLRVNVVVPQQRPQAGDFAAVEEREHRGAGREEVRETAVHASAAHRGN